jgi:hypothetical protein
MKPLTRRRFLGVSMTTLALMPSVWLTACNTADADELPPIHWDRDTCDHCGMTLSDRRFAAQIYGGAHNRHLRFDDIGCMVSWQNRPDNADSWAHQASVIIRVLDFGHAGVWLKPEEARYLRKASPMGYNFAAIAAHGSPAESLGFATIRREVLARNAQQHVQSPHVSPHQSPEADQK